MQKKCDEDVNRILVQIYNNKGVMIKNEELVEGEMVNISNNPSGAYLLRIIKGECVCTKIVVKL